MATRTIIPTTNTTEIDELGVIEQPYQSSASGALREIATVFDRLAFALFVLVLAWAPFPLGSNRPWSWSLLCLMVVGCWILWVASTFADPRPLSRVARGIAVPIILGLLALGWGTVQTLPFVPEAWSHPVWQLADSVLGMHTAATISLSPWQTIAQ